MSQEHEPSLHYTIVAMTPADIESATRMRLQSWLDTYVNDEAGVSREWIEARNQRQLTPEKQAKRLARFGKPDTAAWVAKDNEGRVIGVTTPHRDPDGTQHVGSLYVAKEWLGKGVGSALMQKVIDWADPTRPIELGVVLYNERAKAFYRKWGFVEVPGTEILFGDKLPEMLMVRQGDKQ